MAVARQVMRIFMFPSCVVACFVLRGMFIQEVCVGCGSNWPWPVIVEACVFFSWLGLSFSFWCDPVFLGCLCRLVAYTVLSGFLNCRRGMGGCLFLNFRVLFQGLLFCSCGDCKLFCLLRVGFVIL